MKIGLIGNMNNNNFAFLRYLIDLGYDAKLIIFKNEMMGNSSHFHLMQIHGKSKSGINILFNAI